MHAARIIKQTADVPVVQVLHPDVDSCGVSVEFNHIPTDCLCLGVLKCLEVIAVSHTIDHGKYSKDVVVPLFVVLDSQLILLARHQHGLFLRLVCVEFAAPH